MKSIKHLIVAAIFGIALASTASAGNIPTGVASTIPTGRTATALIAESSITFSEHLLLLAAMMIV